nr:MAG TPA: Synapsin N-terminal [Caudoviricetes sp.]
MTYIAIFIESIFWFTLSFSLLAFFFAKRRFSSSSALSRS